MHTVSLISQEYFGGHMRLQRDRIPDVAFRTFYSRFQPPSLAEGFTSIQYLSFSPNFLSDEERKGWCQWME